MKILNIPKNSTKRNILYGLLDFACESELYFIFYWGAKIPPQS